MHRHLPLISLSLSLSVCVCVSDILGICVEMRNIYVALGRLAT